VNDYPEPTPGPDDVLIAVRLAGICATDLEITHGYMGFTGVPGHEFVGTVAKGKWRAAAWSRRSTVCGRCDMCQHGLNHCRSDGRSAFRAGRGVRRGADRSRARNLHELPDGQRRKHCLSNRWPQLIMIKQCPIAGRRCRSLVGAARSAGRPGAANDRMPAKGGQRADAEFARRRHSDA
jgi:hypothetical protein